MFEAIGTAKVKWESVMADLPKILRANSEDDRRGKLWAAIYALWGNDQRTDEWKLANAAYEHIYNHGHKDWIRFAHHGHRHQEGWVPPTEEEKFLDLAIKPAEYLSELRAYAETYDATFKCLYACDDFVILSLGGAEYAIMLPPEYVEFTPYINYDSLTSAQRHLILVGGTESEEPTDALMEDSATSYAGAQSVLEKKREDAAALRQKMEDVKEARVGELNTLRLEIEAKQKELEQKQAELMAELEARKAEMEIQLEKMEFDILRLSSEIYAIRCYTGECVDFLRIRQGRTATEDTPLVLHQKMRYMDEELGKIASIYNVDFQDKGRFEDLIRYNDHALEAFAPTERSLMLVRVSRTGKSYHNHADYENMLDVSRKYRGGCIAIILRDGENVYVAWTDDEKISFDEEMFFRPGTYEADPAPQRRSFESQEGFEARVAKEEKEKAKKSLNESLGRMFIFSILQGIVDRGMVKFPVRVNVNNPSEYIVRSFADGWLETNKYGSFSDIVKRCNENVSEGDHILSVQSLRAESLKDCNGRMAYNQSWHNDRGRGEKNRTHDVYLSDRTVYPINLVERRADYTLTLHYADGNTHAIGYRDTTEAQVKVYGRNKVKGTKYYRECSRVVSFDVERTSDLSSPEYFVSLEKDGWRETTARANFQVFSDEFINLRYMCSPWLLYTLTTHKTGSIRIGGHYVDFAHVIPYLKTALDFVRKREEEELELLKPVIPGIEKDEEWPVRLSEWKLETGKKLYKQTVKSFAAYYRKSNEEV